MKDKWCPVCYRHKEHKDFDTINPHHDKDIVLEVGYQTITIDKLFGPLVFCNLRIKADPQSGNWIIEREKITLNDEGSETTWESVASFNGQESIEFDET